MKAFIKMLEDAGYTESDSEELGHMEYGKGIAGGKHMVTLGPGRTGDEGCQVVFYFSIVDMGFIEHGASSDTV